MADLIFLFLCVFGWGVLLNTCASWLGFGCLGREWYGMVWSWNNRKEVSAGQVCELNHRDECGKWIIRTGRKRWSGLYSIPLGRMDGLLLKAELSAVGLHGNMNGIRRISFLMANKCVDVGSRGRILRCIVVCNVRRHVLITPRSALLVGKMFPS